MTDRAPEPIPAGPRRRLRKGATTAGVLVFVQSLIGGLVRHMDAGMSCPDAPLCLGQWIPPLVNPLITVHFVHRAMALVVAIFIVALAVWCLRAGLPRVVRRVSAVAAALVVAQVTLGFASVLTVLAVIPVSLHTLVAAVLLVMLVHLSTIAHRAPQDALAAPPVLTG